MGSFFNLHWWISQTPKAQATRGVGNMLSQKFLKSWCSETSFLMFSEDQLCLKCSVFMPTFMFTTLHTSTPISGVKRKWEARNIRRKQEVSSQNGRVGISLEFHCKNFFLLKSVCTWYVFLKSPIHPLKVKWPAPYDHFLHPSAIKLANGFKRSLGEGHIV